MSTLGQLSGSIARNLQRVEGLTKSLIAIRAEVLGKLDALKLTADHVVKAKGIVAEFLDSLVPVLEGKKEGESQQKVIWKRLTDSGRLPADYGADFVEISQELKLNTKLSKEKLDKVSEVVGYLQGEVAEEVRRLRSR